MIVGTRELTFWVAGFFDGEGSFRGCKCVRCKTVAPKMGVEQTTTNQEVIDRVEALLGGTRRSVSRATSRARGWKTRDIERLNWSGDRARKAAALLYPYLSMTKQRDIDEWDTPNPNFGGEPPGRKPNVVYSRT